MGLSVVILAAGKGKRMTSDMPKVMHVLGGLSLLEHVVKTAQSLKPDNIFIVYGNGGKALPDKFNYLPVNWVYQNEQLGTGHAVLQALPNIPDNHQVLILYGDVPLISSKTLTQLLHETPHNGLGLVVTELQDPTGFGRIIRNEVGNIMAIIEHKDANFYQRKIREINTGILTAPAINLKSWLPRLGNKNKQHEYYLTDAVSIAVDEGIPVGGVMAYRTEEVQGVNDRWQLANLERYYQREQARKLALAGTTIKDPSRFDVRGNLTVGSDVTFDINVILEGKVSIGDNCYIGPNVILKDVILADNVVVQSNIVIEGANIDADCVLGPFARIRPGTEVAKKVKIGNFVEVKQSILGPSTKASHLSYLGDANIGSNVNIGAGTITCNYDGVNKWRTNIGDGAFIGSNTALIAPIKIGQNATIGAGSTINKNAPAEQLTLTRAKQTSTKNWQRPSKKINKSTEVNPLKQ